MADDKQRSVRHYKFYNNLQELYYY